jgi:phosphoribosylglycinamide formyltransferase-1
VAIGDALLERVRAICLALPAVSEHSDGSPVLDHHARLAAVFRVRGRSFAWFLDNHHGDGRVWTACKAAPGRAAELVSQHPAEYFHPPYLRRAGWVGIRLDVGGVDWDDIEELVEDSYRAVASRVLLAVLDQGGSPRPRQRDHDLASRNRRPERER